MRANALNSGMGDTVIINTCAVTAEAERQARQTVRRARKDNPHAKIIVTGCAAQINPDSFSSMAEVDLVLGNAEKLQAKQYALPASEEKSRVNDIMEANEIAAHLVSGFAETTRAFVQVQNGCDHRCTFCIIPYGRGNSRSAPAGDIITQIRELTEKGYQEIVLTGVDISDYGNRLPSATNLGQLVRRILKLVPELPRLRISSIDAAEIDADLWAAIAEEERLMPHLHLSVQAGDDMILKRMKRRHNRADILNFCQKARSLRPDIVFGADLIAGFPTESEEMFQNTLNLVHEAGLTWLHVFPYSARKGTPAARMPQVRGEIRKERARMLRQAGETQENIFLHAQIGMQANVLIEKDHFGHSQHFAPVIIENMTSALKIGSIVPVDISHVDGKNIVGKLGTGNS